MSIELLVDIIGWTGAGALLVGYGLVSADRISGTSWGYQALNVLGSLGLIINSFYYGAFPSFGLNIVWIGIGFFALWRSRRSRLATHGPVPPSSG